MPFCGRSVRRCKPFYIGADDPEGAKLRAQAWVKYHEYQLRDCGIPLDFHDAMMLDRAVNFHKPDEVKRAAEDIKRQFKPDTITIDTFFHSTVGADLSQPDVVLPIMTHIQEFLAYLEAHTSMLVHHTPKDGKGFWGSVIIEGWVHAMMHCQTKQGTMDVATLTCERMKGAAKFKQIDIALKTQKVKTQPDEDHIDEVEQLVIASEPISTKPAFGERNEIDTMVFFLDLLGGKATRVRWHERVRDFTTKRDKNGNVVKDGWSVDTFDRRRKELTDVLGWVVGGGGQGGQSIPYQFANIEQVRQVRARVRAKAAEYGCQTSQITPDAGCIRENAEANAEAAGAVWPHPEYPHAIPEGGIAAIAAIPEGNCLAANWPQAATAAIASTDSNGSDLVVPPSVNRAEPDLLKAAKEQLRKGKAA